MKTLDNSKEQSELRAPSKKYLWPSIIHNAEGGTVYVSDEVGAIHACSSRALARRLLQSARERWMEARKGKGV